MGKMEVKKTEWRGYSRPGESRSVWYIQLENTVSPERIIEAATMLRRHVYTAALDHGEVSVKQVFGRLRVECIVTEKR